jgi:hypothetical protein
MQQKTARPIRLIRTTKPHTPIAIQCPLSRGKIVIRGVEVWCAPNRPVELDLIDDFDKMALSIEEATAGNDIWLVVDRDKVEVSGIDEDAGNAEGVDDTTGDGVYDEGGGCHCVVLTGGCQYVVDVCQYVVEG